MISRYSALIGCLLLVWAGCRTSAPVGQHNVTERPPGASTKAVPIDQQAFTVVALTNQLDPKWLDTPTNLFRLGPGDVIEIEILGEGGRTSTAVGPDGKIYFNLLPGLFVWGLTLSETASLINDQMQQFFRDQPQVTVTPRAINSRRVWILGHVPSPGVYPLASAVTLLEAISRAGGVAPSATGNPGDANLRGSFVMRKGQPLPVDLDRLLRKGDLSQNIYLEPDDFVYLRPGEGRYVHLMGAVGRVGAVPFVENMTLVAALVSAGGTVPYAQGNEVAILRGSLTEPTIATANYKAMIKGHAPDLLLEPGDIVYVPFVPYRKLAILADNILRQFVRSVALNEGVRAVDRGASPVNVVVPVDIPVAPPPPVVLP